MTGVSRFVAVIDSDSGVRKAITRLLRAHGYRPQGYASAEAFLARGRTDDPACLVLELKLDGMSGIDLLHRLEADGVSLPVVVMTAADDETTRHNAITTGCVAYLEKPSSAEPLLAAIAKATRPAP
jgi:FixJ family two-component response regulator